MTRFRLLLVLVQLFLSAGLAPRFAEAAVSHCADSRVSVIHAGPPVAEAVCAAVGDALGFMAAHGFETDLAFLVEVVEEPGVPRTFGSYDRRGIRIEVLSPAACRRRGGGRLFGLELDPALYRSIIVHEVAHLVARFNGEDALHDVAGQEYIAFTVQLGTLPPPLLERVLSRFDQPPFAREAEITALLHALGPEVFAVKAWRHFRQPGHGDAFYRHLLTRSPGLRPVP